MTVQAGEYKSRVGLDSLYVAVVSEDSATAYTAGTPAYLAPVAEATLEPTTNIQTQYADDTVFDVMTAEGETKITLTVTNYDPATLATILGKAFDTPAGRLYDNNATPPYCALSFRSLKSNGSYRYFQYMKGRFETPAEDFTTKGESPDPKPVELVFTAIYTIYEWNLGSVTDQIKRIVGDDNTTNFDETGWFTSVQVPSYSAPSSLALDGAVDPADGASGVAVSKTITITFNNALTADAIYNVIVAKADGTFVACTNSLDATAKILTVNPDSNLDASSTYIVSYGVTDIYGDYLVGAVNFGTT